MTRSVDAERLVDGSLGDASIDRLACLIRHRTWADEAMLGRLRRVRQAFGDALRQEQTSREIAALDT